MDLFFCCMNSTIYYVWIWFYFVMDLFWKEGIRKDRCKYWLWQRSIHYWRSPVKYLYKEHFWHIWFVSFSSADTKLTLITLKSVSRSGHQIESKVFMLNTSNRSKTLKSENFDIQQKSMNRKQKRQFQVVQTRIILGSKTWAAKKDDKAVSIPLHWLVSVFFTSILFW